MDFLNLPPTRLPSAALRDLLMELSWVNPMRRDWRGLADLMGFTQRQMDLLEQIRTNDPNYQACMVLKRWEDASQRRGGPPATLRVLMCALSVLEFTSCLQILQDRLKGEVDVDTIVKETRKDFPDEEALRRSFFPPMEDSDVFPMPKDSRRAMTPDEGPASSCLPSLSVSPLTTVQPEEKFSAAVFEQRQAGPVQHSVYTNSSPPPAMTTSPMCTTAPTYLPQSVYISYHHGETRDRRRKIKALAKLLRDQGFTVFYDRFCEQDIQRLSRDCWKEEAIRQSKNIVVVCTPKYYREDCQHTSIAMPATGRSPYIAVDCKLLRIISYSGSKEESSRLMAVVLDGDSPADCVPMWVRSYRQYSYPKDENDFLHCIEGVPKYQLPPVGKKRELRPRQIYFKNAPPWDPYDKRRH